MADSNELHILWTTGDPDTARYMLMMYSTNSMLNHWWDNVTVIIWGASAKLVAENDMIHELIKTAQHAGVKFSACIGCARQLDVYDKLAALGIEIIPWGVPLTELLKSGGTLLTV
ncbi:MAG: DsrE family protein [Peptococcaceae bacterium]|jgi:hypothetical protein|nr:DsrE family protein [Peptococcaceae bacterium]